MNFQPFNLRMRHFDIVLENHKLSILAKCQGIQHASKGSINSTGRSYQESTL
jgi:hypothetical protein